MIVVFRSPLFAASAPMSVASTMATTSHTGPVHPDEQGDEQKPEPIVLQKFPHTLSPQFGSLQIYKFSEASQFAADQPWWQSLLPPSHVLLGQTLRMLQCPPKSSIAPSSTVFGAVDQIGLGELH
jgi:hypothetical protein